MSLLGFCQHVFFQWSVITLKIYTEAAEKLWTLIGTELMLEKKNKKKPTCLLGQTETKQFPVKCDFNLQLAIQQQTKDIIQPKNMKFKYTKKIWPSFFYSQKKHLFFVSKFSMKLFSSHYHCHNAAESRWIIPTSLWARTNQVDRSLTLRQVAEPRRFCPPKN